MTRGRALAHTLSVIVSLALAAAPARPARAAAKPDPAASAARWSDVFADERDSVVFLARAALVRAPFAADGAETLWTAPGEDRLVHVLASPDRRRLAWLARASDQSVTTLWLWDADGVRRRAGYLAFIPGEIEVARFSGGQPSTDDLDATGGRFAALGALSRSGCVNALVWDWSCAGLWLGFRDGVAYAPCDTARVKVMSPALTTELRRLDPAPLMYAEVVRLAEGRDAAMIEQWRDYGRDGSGMRDGTQDPYAPGSGGRKRVEPQPGSYLFYPGLDRLRAFRADALRAADPWAASETTVWWLIGGKRLMSLRAQNPAPELVAEDRDPDVWLEWLPARHTLARARGREVIERAESGGGDRLRLATGSRIAAVLATPDDPVRAIVTRDSLLMWDTRDDSVRGVALRGAAPTRMLIAAGGARVLVSAGDGKEPPRLDRLDPGASALAPLEAPEVKKGVVTLSPSGRRVLLVAPLERGARTVWVRELAGGDWRLVAVPDGLLGWEQVTPR